MLQNLQFSSRYLGTMRLMGTCLVVTCFLGTLLIQNPASARVKLTASSVIKSGVGLSQTARYPNVATVRIDGAPVSLDLVAKVVTDTHAATPLSIELGSGDAEPRVSITPVDSSTLRTVVLSWSLVRAGTTDEIPATVSFTIWDLDNNGSDWESLEVTDLKAYALETPTDITVTTPVANTWAFESSDNAEPDNSDNWVRIYLSLPQQVTYKVQAPPTRSQDGIVVANSRYFYHDGLSYIGFVDEQYYEIADDFDDDVTFDDIDTDDDNDGIPDLVEVPSLSTDPSGDTDGDGVPDWNDPDTVACTPDTSNAEVCAVGTLPTAIDADGDGIPNHLDLDSDGDGITDAVEAGGVDVDGNGIPDDCLVDGMGQCTTIISSPPDTDSDGVYDYLDTDSDSDGLSDTLEAFDVNDNEVADDLTFTGNDHDGDGIDDAVDPDCPDETGCTGGGLIYDQQSPLDADGNGVPDQLQTCGDGNLTDAPGDGEACDDGNLIAHDGCDATCAIEDGWNCDTTASPTECTGCQDAGTATVDYGCTDENPVCSTDGNGNSTCVACEDTGVGVVDYGCDDATPACVTIDGAVSCVACDTDDDCAADHRCDTETHECVLVPKTCTDGVKNQDETDIDCGGALCPACENDSTCETDEDCESGLCYENVCEADTDHDGVADRIEDADGDGVVDPDETDPNLADTDGDGLTDGEEDVNGNGHVDEGETDPRVYDTDQGGVGDGTEIERRTDPLNPADDLGDVELVGDGCLGSIGGHPTNPSAPLLLLLVALWWYRRRQQ